MSSSSLRRTPSVQLILRSPVAGSVQVICPSGVSETQPQTPRKRKITDISTTTPAERIAMEASAPSCISRAPSSRLSPSLPSLTIPSCQCPQFSNTPSEADSQYEEPPSPTATEIIDVEGEDFTRTAIQHGVNVRDFAYEAKPAPIEEAVIREYWDPVFSLIRHDIHIRRPYTALSTHHLTGKDLWRLLDSGWVVMEEAKRHWKAEAWKAMETYRDQPGGPYPYVIGFNRRKPTAAFRARLRESAFPFRAFDIYDEDIFVPADEPGMWDGEAKTEVVGKEGNNDEAESRSAEKRRKLNVDEQDETKHILPTLSQVVSVSAPSLSSSSGATSVASTPAIGRATSRLTRSPSKKRGLRRTRTLVPVQ